MIDDTKVLAEFIKGQTGKGWSGSHFKPPFRIQSPEDLSKVDRWLAKNVFRQKPHWTVLNTDGLNPFGVAGWFDVKEDAETFVKIMNAL